MTQLPPSTVGSAVGVLLYSFICLLADLLLIWLLWVHRERLSYVALIAYFVQLCVICSIIQQIYHYAYYADIAWEQLAYIKANYPNAEVIFKNGNYGFLLVMSNIRFFCYIIESTFLLTYTLHITLSIYGVWARHRRGERIYAVLSRVIPPVLTGITMGLEYTKTLQSSWIAYMIVANFLAVASCASSIVLIVAILWKYIDSKSVWRNIKTGPTVDGSAVSWRAWILKSWRSRHSDPHSEDDPEVQDHVPSSLFDKNWLVFRLSFAIILISGFILATVLVHLPTPSVMGHQTTTSEPDLGVAQAKTSIIGYIYGVTPGLAIPIVFGLTRPFRQTLYKTFVPKRWQEKNTAQQKPRASAIMGHHVLAVGPGAPTVGSQQRGMVGNVAALGQQTHEGGSYARLEGSYEMGATKSGDGPSWLYAGTDDAIKLGSSGSTASFHPLIQHRN